MLIESPARNSPLVQSTSAMRTVAAFLRRARPAALSITIVPHIGAHRASTEHRRCGDEDTAIARGAKPPVGQCELLFAAASGLAAVKLLVQDASMSCTSFGGSGV